MLRRTFVSFLLVLLASSALEAKPKEKVFNNSAQEVFQAALRTARERHVVTYVDEKNLMLTFETGTSALSYGFNANASVEQQSDGKSKLIVNVQKKNAGKNASLAWGAGDRMADKFFDQVEEELARASKQTVAAKGEVEHVEKPSAAQVTTAPDVSSGTVAVSAVPEGADVSVDGAFVGNTPATLKLAPGKHKVTVAGARLQGVDERHFRPSWIRCNSEGHSSDTVDSVGKCGVVLYGKRDSLRLSRWFLKPT
jgi:hypothetical protein